MAIVERALVVGLGSIGQRHLRLLRNRLPAAQIMVLRHTSCGPLENADFCTTSQAEALAFAPNIAIIATPAPFHAAPAKALARAGTHLLVEKPLSTDAVTAREIADVAREAGVVLQVGYNLRYLESLRVFRIAITSGRIGRVTSVRSEVGQYLPNWRPGRNWRDAVSARADLGGGVLLELSHELDFLRWIFGEVRAVRGWMGQQGGLGIDVEDTVHAVLGFSVPAPPDAIGVAPVASVTLDFMRRDTVRRCVAIGEGGTVAWDGVTTQVTIAKPGGDKIMIHDNKPNRDASYIAQLESFLASIETGAQVAVSSVDGVKVMEIIDAVRRSHAAGGLEMLLDAPVQDVACR